MLFFVIVDTGGSPSLRKRFSTPAVITTDDIAVGALSRLAQRRMLTPLSPRSNTNMGRR
jgi:hypothetical protein